MNERKENLDEIFRRAEYIRKKESCGRRIVAYAAGMAACAAVLVFLLIITPEAGAAASAAENWRYGSLLLSGSAGGYILIGAVALALGILTVRLFRQIRILKEMEHKKEES